ncbi:polyurethane esterase [Dryocola sp. BD613]|uniref:polyurethane esterase n=1 Tax=Dryocola sp. BD613 TaxID=3133272 RepID=UPI003F4F4232
MSVFNLNGLDQNTSKETFLDALALSTYAYHNLDNGFMNGYQNNGIGLGLPLTLLTALFGNSESEGVIGGLPWTPDSEGQALAQVQQVGWEIISAEALHYSGVTDHRGTYFGEKADYQTAQAEIMGKYDRDGNLVQIGIAFRGTSGPRESLIADTLGDIKSDLLAAFGAEDYAQTYVREAFDELLNRVASFAKEHGLGGEDIIVSGHSLGGLAVNSMAAQSDSMWEGFYSQSHYVAFASPTQYQEGNKVLNAGFENDPVFRVLDGTEFNLASILVHDSPKASSTDNIINFNDYYSSDLWNILPFSIMNLPSWISHLPFFYQDSMSRILNSEFYPLMEQDSTIIVSSLSSEARDANWVQDLNRYAEKHSGPTYIIGSDYNDLLKGGTGNDFLEGRKGDDRFRDESGYNIILGGEGHNTLELQHTLKDYTIASDGNSLYLLDPGGELTLAENIATVRSSEHFLGVFGHDIDYQVSDSGLKNGTTTEYYASSVKGDETDNSLTAVKGEWLFGLGGNDVLTGAGNNIMVGGTGNDLLIGEGEHNTYLFTGEFGHDTIHNFGQTDKLIFMGVSDSGNASYSRYMSEDSNNSMVLNFGGSSVTLCGFSMDIFTQNQLLLT